MKTEAITIISVVRDFEMYDRLVRNNPRNAGATFVCFDNNIENRTIPARYNSFLDTYDYAKESWFVFCHEDFQFLEPLAGKLDLMDKGKIYGPIGQSSALRMTGMQVNSNRDGSRKVFVGTPCRKPAKVHTLDCECLMVHSSLVARHCLRFDDNLTYDLYAEDFCANANANYGIEAMVLPIRTWHYSFGNVQPRFLTQLAYLNRKYAASPLSFATNAQYFIGGRSARLAARRQRIRKLRLAKLFNRRYTSHGRCVIELFGLKIWYGFRRKFP